MRKFISNAEISYVKNGFECNVRCDGRGLTDFRSITIESDIFPHLNGSCRLKLGSVTDILCSVKVMCNQIYVFT